MNTPVRDVTVPSAITLSNFPDVRRRQVPERGGHSMAHEEPEQLAADVRGFFGSVA